MTENLLSIRNLSVGVCENSQSKWLLNEVNLEIKEQSIMALVGGSGSGKTTTGLAVMRLMAPALSIGKGSVLYKGKDILRYSPLEIRALRGSEIGMVFQEPLNAFNPVFSIGSQIEEVLRYHTKLNYQKRQIKIRQLLDIVGLPDPERIIKHYPHQLSGGMRQRAMIAQAIAADPQLIIADEPTSSLDVTLQARIMDLFRKLKKDLKLSILLITHDLGVVSHLADEVTVMTKGKVVECGATQEVLGNPQHSYTTELMKATL